MSFTLTLTGGPPWGLRVSNDEELRPVVAKILPGGRAYVTGVRIGDHIEAVNNVPIETTAHAHNLIQESNEQLLLTINRNSNRFHQTVAREKLSSSCQSSPAIERRLMIPSSVPSSPIQPRAAQLFKQTRLDVQGVQGSADNKRRFFEQMNNPAQTTDSLLQRKIQLGYFGGVPSESTTGSLAYGSVGGDFAGVNSGRTSPLSSLMSGEEEEERTLHEGGLESRNLAEQLRRDLGMYSNEMIFPGPSQWTVKTETHGTAPAEGAIEVPNRRSVAALRQAITDKLEMKSPAPNGSSEGRRTPSWNNVKVFEGVDEDTPKPTFGRVLEGPIAPNKYYQGVPPPSYYVNSSVHSKPPTIPPKPPKPSVDLTNEFTREDRTIVRNSFLNSIAARAEEAPSPAPSDLSSQGPPNNLYYNNYYGQSRDDPMSKSLISVRAREVGLCVNRQTRTLQQPPDPAPEDPTCSIETSIDPIRNLNRGSMDLESSQLLKSKSPSPYNSTTADHYATIRRVPTPVRLQVEEVPATARKTFSYSTTTNDSGYGDALSPRGTFDTFSTNSTVPAVDQTIDTLSLESSRPERPESLLSFSTVDGEGNEKEEEITPLRPVSNEPEMSFWYKKMFTKMHKLDPSSESVLRQQLRESSPSVSSTISRSLTPTSCVSVRPPSRFECELVPRRARSVGRVIDQHIEPEKESSPTAIQVAEEIAELKRISKEELMLRQKAERLQEELEEQRQRRHGYLPSAVPSLQKNFDRFEGLMNDYGKEASPAPSSGRSRSPAPTIKTATVVYKFVPNSPRELPLNKGDVVRINRQVDNNWLEGERNGRCGIFPASYVQINNDTDSRQKMRAVYPFTARNSNEMSLKLGETIIWRRDIDQNWAEGANHIGEIGIFPKCYVRPIEEEMKTPGSVIPARPKTPKITFETDIDEDRTVTFDPVPHNPVRQEQPIEVPIAREEPATIQDSYSTSFPSETRSRRHPAFSEEIPVGFTNGYKDDQNLGRENTREVNRQTREHNRAVPTSGWTGSNLASLIPRGSEVYRAAFAYVPQKEDELALSVDDIIFVVEKCDDGWFIGTSLRDGQFGTFPGNYVLRH